MLVAAHLVGDNPQPETAFHQIEIPFTNTGDRPDGAFGAVVLGVVAHLPWPVLPGIETDGKQAHPVTQAGLRQSIPETGVVATGGLADCGAGGVDKLDERDLPRAVNFRAQAQFLPVHVLKHQRR